LGTKQRLAKKSGLNHSAKVVRFNKVLRFTRNFTWDRVFFPAQLPAMITPEMKIMNGSQRSIISHLCQQPDGRRFHGKAIRDYLKLGIGFVQFLFN